MIRYLPHWEIGGYFTLTLTFLFYSSYRIFTYGKLIYQESESTGFSAGWSIIGRPRDDMDYEWFNWKNFFVENAFWYIMHLIMSQIVRMLKPKSISYCHTAISFLFLFRRYEPIVTVTIFASTLFFYFLSKNRSKITFWTGSFIFLIIMNLLKSSSSFDYLIMTTSLGEQKIFEIFVATYWILVKCISFGIDSIEYRQNSKRREDENEDFTLQAFLGYIFYFPTFHLGPIIIYSRYRQSLKQTQLTTKKILTFLVEISLVISYMIILEFALHFFYIYNLQANERIVAMLDSWALYGLCHLLGQFFHMKYVIFYGIGIAFARLDNIDPPRKPKCVSRIHLYSDMWKYFDHGLYEFLFKYIYCALCTKTSSIGRKLMASFLTFVYIYLWHGLYFYIFIWSLTNYLCLSVENFSRHVSRTSQYRNFIQKYCNETWEYRWNGLFGTLLLIPAIISNSFFLANYEVGLIFVQRTFFNGCLHYLCVFGCVICLFFTSESIKRYENSV